MTPLEYVMLLDALAGAYLTVEKIMKRTSGQEPIPTIEEIIAKRRKLQDLIKEAQNPI